MTGPRIDIPTGRPLSPDEWDKQRPSGLTRVLSPDEWDQARGMSPQALQAWKLPGLQKVHPDAIAIQRDATAVATAQSEAQRTKGTRIGGLHGQFLRQIVDPILENPLQTIGTTAGLAMPATRVPLGLYMAYKTLEHVAQYGGQKGAEVSLPEDIRKYAEADPERITGEAAAWQAIALGLAPMLHVGVKALGGLDFGAGMLESGAAGMKELPLRPDFPELAAVEQSKADYHVRRIAEDRADLEATPLSTILTEEQKPGGPARRPQKDALAPSVADYEARRLAEETAALSESRTAAAEAVAQADARRPARRAATAHYFQSPQGAELLGAMAARHGLPQEASPYHPTSPLDALWKEGHAAATESYPEGFSMGGALADSRIPGAAEVPRVAGGVDVPEGATPETIALANALKPSPYRAHSSEALAEAALDAQTAVEQAQLNLQMDGEASMRANESTGESVSDQTPFYANAGKTLARAKARLAQIEREFSLRGVAGDALAEIMQATKEARLEREGMSQEAMLGQTFEDFAGSGPSGDEPRQPLTLAPIEGTGPMRESALSASVVRKAVAHKLDLGMRDVQEYRGISMADQSDRAVALLARDPALARRIALGEVYPPADLLPESVFVAVENKAIAEGDVATIRDLATRGELSADATRMGQRIRSLGERDPESPVRAIKDIMDARTDITRQGGEWGRAPDGRRITKEARIAAKRKVFQQVANTVDEIRAHLAQASISPDAWTEFVESLRC